MAAFVDFVRGLLGGTVRLSGLPVPDAAGRRDAERLLASAYADLALDLPGPTPPFDANCALGAAAQVGLACWFLLDRRPTAEEVARALPPPTPPATTAQHLSADVAFRFLGQLHRRARGLGVGDVLTRWLERVLCVWPLSGALSDVAEPPEGPLDFGGHAGLCLLYAERLARRPRPAWVPPAGPAREAVELVFAERGLPLPAGNVAR
jgi:hypothetical protein